MSLKLAGHTGGESARASKDNWHWYKLEGKKKTKGTAIGMTDFINPNDNNKSISQLIKELTGGLGMDYCFECIGVPPLINEALQATKMVRL